MGECYLKPHHIGISVPNIVESIQWYSKVLGCTVDKCQYFEQLEATVAFLHNGEFSIELFQYKEPIAMPEGRRYPNEDLKTIGTKHICFGVKDVSILVMKLRELGVEIVIDVQVMDGTKMCFIRDNSGVLIEFIETK